MTAGPVEDGWLLIMVKAVRLPPAAVWGVLTDEQQLSAWAPMTSARTLPDGEPDDGVDEVTLSMTEDDEIVIDLGATVTEVDPPWLLAYRWGVDQVRWQLERIDGGTRLTLRHRVTARPHLAQVAAGWHLSLAALDRLIDATTAPAPPWQALHDQYEAAFAEA